MSATLASGLSRVGVLSPAAILDVPKKVAVIRLRWPVVIIASYLLVFSSARRLDPLLTHGFLLLYMLSNAALYWVDEDTFSGSYFYAPLVFFDLVVLSLAMSLSGQVGKEFYIAYFLTIVLCGICKDFRGWLVVSILAPLICGYFVLQSAVRADPVLYLQVPFPLVVALFYGYFVQVQNFERTIREQAEREAEQRKTQEQVRDQLERIRTLNQINLAVTSSLDIEAVLKVLQESVERLLPHAATVVWLVSRGSGELEVKATRNLDPAEWRDYPWRGQGLTTEVFRSRRPVAVGDLQTDRRTWNPEFFRSQGLVSFLGVPLSVKGEIVGVMSFYTKDEHEFTEEEVEFFTSVAGQAAVAIHNSQLFEQITRQAVELEKSNRVKDEFLNTMSHELRTPLNVIMGYTGLIKDGMLGGINAEQDRSLGKILGRSQDLLGMISGILQAASLEAGLVTPEKKPVNLTEWLRDLESAQEAPANREVTLLWDYAANLPTIDTDEDKLRQVLRHLIRNAVKFTLHGRVTVRARHFPLERRVRFEVSDTGIGIPPDCLSLIFEKFFQVDNAETRINGGVGLGLYLAKRLVELLGGTIEARSEPGQGSTFVLTLPA